eukprot:gnl/Spiro4/1236_TR658_c0_g1_i1.p1 gnl/Spiro4/1236_TR658_c0_g1~~gnl/Spiro4/1236_TR658_c0_g1_i1.p1  ORF type:complete len:150 (+),score=22.68 gnl/Spiro4/1236_TR658_c0_g1_i1:52-501(+)
MTEPELEGRSSWHRSQDGESAVGWLCRCAHVGMVRAACTELRELSGFGCFENGAVAHYASCTLLDRSTGLFISHRCVVEPFMRADCSPPLFEPGASFVDVSPSQLAAGTRFDVLFADAWAAAELVGLVRCHEADAAISLLTRSRISINS